MTGIKLASGAMITAVLAAFASPGHIQISSEANWATEFLLEYGWVGLFVISCIFNIYQYRKVDKMRDKFDQELEKARNELVEEYKTRIDQLWKQSQGL